MLERSGNDGSRNLNPKNIDRRLSSSIHENIKIGSRTERKGNGSRKSKLEKHTERDREWSLIKKNPNVVKTSLDLKWQSRRYLMVCRTVAG